MNVLVVTDEADAAWYAGAGLSGRGFVVRVAGGADEALRSAADAPPDVVLMDCDTPGVDGAALAWALRAQPRADRAPLLVVAVRGAGAEAARCVEAAPAADLSLPRDGEAAGGLVVGVLSQFRDFLGGLYAGRESPAAAAGHPAAPAEGEPARPVAARTARPTPNARAPKVGEFRCSVS